MVRLVGGPTVDDNRFYLGPVGGTPPDPPPPVTYSLAIGDNTHLRLEHDVTLVRRFSGRILSHATIVNKGGESGNVNIRVSGGTITTGGATENFSGKHLGFDKVQFLSVDNVRFLQIYDAWNAFFRDCQDVTISNLNIGDADSDDDELFEDGLHLAGGSRIAVTNCNIFTGDDCIALVHEQPPDSFPATPLTDFVASNCTLWSVGANAFRVRVLTNEINQPPPISRVRLSNIVARTGVEGSIEPQSGGITIVDEYGLELVSEVEIDGFTLDATYNNLAGLELAGVAHCRLANVTILRPEQRATIDDCSDVELRNVVIDSPQGNGQSCLAVAGDATVTGEADCTNIRVIGGRFSNSRHHGIQLGVVGTSPSPSFSVTGFEVSGTAIDNSQLNGLLIWNASRGVVVGNSIEGFGFESTGSYGIQELGDHSDNNLIIANWIADEDSTPIYEFFGSNTEVARNLTRSTVDIADSGGFRQTIDGWFVAAIQPSASEEMGRNSFGPAGGAAPAGAGRFRAPRDGSITGIVLNVTVAAAGTLVIVAYVNSGTPGSGGTPAISAVMPAGQTRVINLAARNVYPFLAGDEIYLEIATNNYTAGGMAIAAVEVET